MGPDGSSTAEQALPFLKSLAQAYSARLIVVHVNEFPGPGGLSGLEDEVQAAIRKQVEDPTARPRHNQIGSLICCNLGWYEGNGSMTSEMGQLPTS